jgi:hypothetical protein
MIWIQRLITQRRAVKFRYLRRTLSIRVRRYFRFGPFRVGLERPTRSVGSISIRSKGASVGSVVNAHSVMEHKPVEQAPSRAALRPPQPCRQADWGASRIVSTHRLLRIACRKQPFARVLARGPSRYAIADPRPGATKENTRQDDRAELTRLSLCGCERRGQAASIAPGTLPQTAKPLQNVTVRIARSCWRRS